LRRRIEGKSIVLFEDSADTITYTKETDLATTSFYASHLITAGGTGGMVMFNDEKLLKQATMYRDWGRIGDNSEDIKTRFEFNIDGIPYDYKFLYGAVGYNMKCSEMNAAFGLAQLARLAEIKAKRHQIFQRYLDNLSDVNI
jgi:CDP-6-deoxy-D-xylo-4-hexulose-3-dehydrase